MSTTIRIKRKVYRLLYKNGVKNMTMIILPSAVVFVISLGRPVNITFNGFNTAITYSDGKRLS